MYNKYYTLHKSLNYNQIIWHGQIWGRRSRIGRPFCDAMSPKNYRTFFCEKPYSRWLCYKTTFLKRRIIFLDYSQKNLPIDFGDFENDFLERKRIEFYSRIRLKFSIRVIRTAVISICANMHRSPPTGYKYIGPPAS